MRFLVMTAWRNIIRHPTKSLLAIILSMLFTLFLLAYTGNILANRNQLVKIKETVPVTVEVTNIASTLTSDLCIPDELLQRGLATGLVRDVKYYSRLYFDFGFGIPIPAHNDVPIYQIWGITRADDLPIQVSAEGEYALTYLDGYDINLLSDSEAVCIANTGLLEAKGLKLGDSIDLSLFERTYQSLNERKCERIGDATLRIVASYTPEDPMDPFAPSLACPAGWARSYFGEKMRRFNHTSAQFTVMDSFQLNEFKSAMRSAGFQNISTMAEPKRTGNALIVHDSTFIQAVTPIQRNIALMERLYPALFVLIAFLGFLVSYLLLQSRRREIAISRSLGTGSVKTLLLLLFESALLLVTGLLVGLITLPILAGGGSTQLTIALAGYVVTYLLGSMAAILLLGRMSVMEQLTKLD